MGKTITPRYVLVVRDSTGRKQKLTWSGGQPTEKKLADLIHAYNTAFRPNGINALKKRDGQHDPYYFTAGDVYLNGDDYPGAPVAAAYNLTAAELAMAEALAVLPIVSLKEA